MNTMVKVDVVKQAEAFARLRFAAMVRPNKAQEPKINHMREVAQLVDEAGGSDDEAAAAWLHDILEDTPTTYEEITDRFGPHVAMIVIGLTDPAGIHGLEGEESIYKRKMMQAERLRNEPRSVRLVKLADQISNLRSVRHDPPRDWTRTKAIEYIRGAWEVAQVCRGISQLLDDYFFEAHQSALIARSY